ncbi:MULTISPECIES: aspartyl-phosphate phosphatase Spo0E family protein [Bacillaceae]|uniref:Aspartyl-phosphate phosphatase Spo0E family protein n=1 Tax=Evansella alkalicola TaxID=745819 RepID=A0ABS6JSD2_9BACI|nr:MULTISPECIES: aspartyl-phosphate phosphatase Spo0E family protein [Bacillaceae]MBU9720177.1 aspartyl-phosphate phosphatase Spo0E family protein [Bacillus alkalicola]
MSIRQKELLEEIEVARSKMHRLSSKKPRTSNEVVQVSTYLDKLLNKYQLTNYQNCKLQKENQ